MHPGDATQRHVEARAGRTVDKTLGDDGMAWWGLWTDAVTVAKIDARVDAGAAKQSQVEGETRTLAQLRADAAADLLTGAGTAWEVKAHVHLDVPATILLDQPDLLKKAHTNRAVLEGYGPIDDETARWLLADAPSFRRVFMDSIIGYTRTAHGRIRWRSPTGYERDTDPPPF